MTLTIPNNIAAQVSPEAAALCFAIGLFASEEVTLSQAAEVAGLSQPAFLRELGKRQIPIHYGVDEFNADLKTIDRIVGR